MRTRGRACEVGRCPAARRRRGAAPHGLRRLVSL